MQNNKNTSRPTRRETPSQTQPRQEPETFAQWKERTTNIAYSQYKEQLAAVDFKSYDSMTPGQRKALPYDKTIKMGVEITALAGNWTGNTTLKVPTHWCEPGYRWIETFNEDGEKIKIKERTFQIKKEFFPHIARQCNGRRIGDFWWCFPSPNPYVACFGLE